MICDSWNPAHQIHLAAILLEDCHAEAQRVSRLGDGQVEDLGGERCDGVTAVDRT